MLEPDFLLEKLTLFSVPGIAYIAQIIACGYLLHQSLHQIHPLLWRFLFQPLFSQPRLLANNKRDKILNQIRSAFQPRKEYSGRVLHYRIVVFGLIWQVIWFLIWYSTTWPAAMLLFFMDMPSPSLCDSNERSAYCVTLIFHPLIAALLIRFAVVAIFNFSLTPKERGSLKVISQHQEYLLKAANTPFQTMFTMTDGKVYVGWISGLAVDDETEKTEWISIMPVVSGYREKETKKVWLLVDYFEYYQESKLDNPEEKAPLIVVLPMDKIISMQTFDANFYYRDLTSRERKQNQPFII